MSVQRLLQRFWQLRLWLLALLAGGGAIAFHGLNLQRVFQIDWQAFFNAWIIQNPLMFILSFNVATLLCVPASLLAIKAGYTFGLIGGTAYVLVAALLGATLAFLIGRHLAHPWLQRQVQGDVRFRAIADATTREGWKIVLLTRLSPLFPFNLTNYIFGLTPISLKHYSLGSLGILPGTLFYTYMGALSHEFKQVDLSAPPMPFSLVMAQWGLRGVGLVATLIVTLHLNRIAKQALKRHLNAQSTHSKLAKKTTL